jgi:hypothetical protein
VNRAEKTPGKRRKERGPVRVRTACIGASGTQKLITSAGIAIMVAIRRI